MATLRNEKNVTAINRDSHEDHPRNNRARNINSPRVQEDYISQFSEEIESRVTKKLSQEFSETESRILGALSRLDEFLLNPIHHRIQREETRERMKAAPRMILILQWVSP